MKNIFNFFNHHTIISDFDKNHIEHTDKEKIFVVPNGINTKYFKK